MTCEDFGPVLVAYLYDELDPGEREQAEIHLAGCATCRSRLEEYRSVRQALGSFEPIEPSPEVEARLFQQVHTMGTEYRRRDRSLLRRVIGSVSKRGKWHTFGALAAALLIVVALGLFVAMPVLRSGLPGQSNARIVSFEQAVQEAGFPLLVPESLPPDLSFETAILRSQEGGSFQVELRWRDVAGGDLGPSVALRQKFRPLGAPAPGIRPGDEVRLRGQVATMARDAHEVRDDKTGASRPSSRIVLTWLEGNAEIILEGRDVSEAELLRIAESLRPAQR